MIFDIAHVYVQYVSLLHDHSNTHSSELASILNKSRRICTEEVDQDFFASRYSIYE